MRFLVVLYMLLTMPLTPMLYAVFGMLCAIALAWDVYETLKPGLKIITNPGNMPGAAPPSSAVPPGVGQNITRLLEIRKKCAQENNCADCQAFIDKFKELMTPDEKDVHAAPEIVTGAPKNGIVYDPTRGYL